MTEKDQGDYEVFVAKALRALQLQNCALEKQLFSLQAKIHSLEELIQWNTIYGDFVLPPKEMIVRTADGRLCLHERQEEETDV